MKEKRKKKIPPPEVLQRRLRRAYSRVLEKHPSPPPSTRAFFTLKRSLLRALLRELSPYLPPPLLSSARKAILSYAWTRRKDLLSSRSFLNALTALQDFTPTLTGHHPQIFPISTRECPFCWEFRSNCSFCEWAEVHGKCEMWGSTWGKLHEALSEIVSHTLLLLREEEEMKEER